MSRYTQIIERIFHDRFGPGVREVEFKREDIVAVAAELGLALPKNIGDVLYTFRYRAVLPESIRATAPDGLMWIIRPAGTALYRFVAVPIVRLAPNPDYLETRIPDATPGIIATYALNDEQALLAVLRYNRLVDIFTGVTCYSLQSHLRTTVREIGQVETDEVYVGVDRRGAQFVFPVQAKGGSDALNVVQIEQDAAMCRQKFPRLICRPIGAQFMPDRAIALFELAEADGLIRIAAEKHYRLVPSGDVTPEELALYGSLVE